MPASCKSIHVSPNVKMAAAAPGTSGVQHIRFGIYLRVRSNEAL